MVPVQVGDEHIDLARLVSERLAEHAEAGAAVEDDRIGALGLDRNTRGIAAIALQRRATTGGRTPDTVECDVDRVRCVPHGGCTVVSVHAEVKGV